eukprot:jgi/Ulvmu1/6630/UM003_0268.1
MSRLRLVDDFDLSGNKLHESLPLGPEGVLHGQMPNGMSYYVNRTSKPKNRASIKLAVRIGSVVEEEHERGVAHILEHLAFSATSEENAQYKVIEKLRAIGCEFGPCLNAYTSIEETVYEFLVPTDDEEVLPQVLGIVADFAFKIRCSAEDLERERGPVLEEWRGQRSASGRAMEALWKLMHEGSKYADRMPIGLESVIRGVSADTVLQFYQRWYHPHNMAVVVVGDFEDLGAVQELVEAALGFQGADRPPPPPPPEVPWQPHSTPRAHVFVDRESQHSECAVMYKAPRAPMATPSSWLEKIKEDLFHLVLNRRLAVVSRRPGCPFYAAQSSTEALMATCATHTCAVMPLPRCTLDALETVLRELARLRLHSAEPREVEVARMRYLTDYESLYLERDQVFCDDLASEYVRHFTRRELVVGAGAEARLAKTLCQRTSVGEVLAVAEGMRAARSCIVKAEHHRAGITEEQLLQVLERVDAAEAAGEIEAWADEVPPEKLLEEEPPAGTVTDSATFEALGARELLLSNGMRVTLRRSDLQDDQILLAGFAPGGVTEQPAAQVTEAALACTLAEEMGMFGFKPHVLMDVLAGKRASVAASLSTFWRMLSGDISPLDLETAMQLIHKLFTTTVEADEAHLDTTMQILRQGVVAKQRDPMAKFTDAVQRLNYGSSPYLRPPTLRDLRRINVHRACAFCSAAFRNPAEYTLCFVGKIEEDVFVDMAQRYLASIPAAPGAAVMRAEEVRGLNIAFPQRPVTARVPVHMMEPRAQVQVAFPVEVPFNEARVESYWLLAICKLLEHRLTQKLRFEGGAIYSVGVSPFFGHEAPSRRDAPIRGDVAVQFSCAPGAQAGLAAAVVAEVALLQERGPSEEEVATALALEQRTHEVDMESNQWWLEMMLASYQSRQIDLYGSPDAVFAADQAARQRMREQASAEAFTKALRRLLPWPCARRHTVVTTVEGTVWHVAADVLRTAAPWLLGALALGALWMWRSQRLR